jgi:uncharacterized protein YeaO (DUF488 family)
MTVRIRRAYDDPGPEDGQRILVDGVWPRGRTRAQLAVEAWFRDVAPSADLRRWFGHDPGRWSEFQRRYRAELDEPTRRDFLDRLVERAASGNLTLVYGARDEEHNQARVIAEVIRERVAARR